MSTIENPTEEQKIWRKVLEERSDLTALREFCMDLGINYLNLEEGNHKLKLISFFDLLIRKKRLEEFKEYIFTENAWGYLKDAYQAEVFQTKKMEFEGSNEDISPYLGLETFEEVHSHLYFGRKPLIKELVQRIEFTSSQNQTNLLAIIGASGSGKSSLARAGVIPSLREKGWTICKITPTENPLQSLARALTAGETNQLTALTLQDNLAKDHRILNEYLHRQLDHDQEQRFILLIDQFEELFTLCTEETIRNSFVDNLLFALELAQKTPLFVLLTLRADFYHHIAWSEGLRELLEKQQKYVGRMTKADMRKAIEGPAYVLGYEIEAGLADRILGEIENEPGNLPLLSHVLRETWNHREGKDGKKLTLRGYQESGGVQEAIAKTADDTYDALSDSEQKISRNIFTRLTELGEGSEDTRHRLPLKDLIPFQSDGSDVIEVMARLASARLLTTNWDKERGIIVDISHEALIRKWDKLRSWIEEDREGLRVHKKLNEAADYWNTHEHQDADLYQGTRLALAYEWWQSRAPTLSKLEMTFLNASQQHQLDLEAAREEAIARELAQAKKLAEALEAKSVKSAELAAESEKRRQIEEDARHQAEQAGEELKTRRNWAVAAAIIAAFLALAAIFFANQSNSNLKIAQENEREALQLADLANASRLILQGEAAYEQEPLVALGLIIEGLEIAKNYGEEEAYLDDHPLAKSILQMGRTTNFVGTVDKAFNDTNRKWAVIQSNDGTNFLFNTHDQSTIFIPEKIERHIFSPNDDWVILEHEGKETTLLNLNNQEKVSLPTTSTFRAFSPHGNWVLFDQKDEYSFLINPENQNIQILEGNLKFANFGNTQELLILYYSDGPLMLFDLINNTQVEIETSHALNFPKFSVNDEWVLIDYKGSGGFLLNTNDTTTQIPLSGPVKNLIFSPGYQWVIIDYADEEFNNQLISLTDLQKAPLSLQGNLTRGVFDPFGKWLAIDYNNDSFNDGLINLQKSEEILFVEYEFEGEAAELIFSPDGTWLTLDLLRANGVLFDLRNEEINAIALPSEISSSHFTSLGEYLLLDLLEHNGVFIELYVSTSLQPLPFPIETVGISPDEQWILTDYLNNPGLVIKADEGFRNPTRQINSEVLSGQFSPNDLGLLINDENGKSVLYWKIDTFEHKVNLGTNVQSAYVLDSGSTAIVSYNNDMTYLLDLEWLNAVHDKGQEPTVEDLINLACEIPLNEGETLRDPVIAAELQAYFDQIDGLGSPKACG